MTKLEASRLVAMLVATFRPARWDELSQQVFESAIEDLDFELAKRAVSRLLTVARFMPVPAEIREAATELKLGPTRPGGEAWGDVLDAIRRVGGYAPQPDFADPLVGECVNAFGWRALCFEGDGDHDRARFIQYYDQLAKTRRSEQVSGVTLPRLPSGVSSNTKALPPPQGPENALAPPRRVTAGPSRAELSVVARPMPERSLTGRRMSVDELEAELAKAGGGRG